MRPSLWSLTTRRVNDVTILDVAGRLTLGGAAAEFSAAISNALAKGENKLLVNLADVTYVDSCGIGKLTLGLKDVTAAGGSMKLLNVNARVAGLMKLTRVYPLFSTHRDESAALISFNSAEAAGVSD